MTPMDLFDRVVRNDDTVAPVPYEGLYEHFGIDVKGNYRLTGQLTAFFVKARYHQRGIHCTSWDCSNKYYGLSVLFHENKPAAIIEQKNPCKGCYDIQWVSQQAAMDVCCLLHDLIEMTLSNSVVIDHDIPVETYRLTWASEIPKVPALRRATLDGIEVTEFGDPIDGSEHMIGVVVGGQDKVVRVSDLVFLSNISD